MLNDNADFSTLKLSFSQFSVVNEPSYNQGIYIEDSFFMSAPKNEVENKWF